MDTEVFYLVKNCETVAGNICYISTNFLKAEYVLKSYKLTGCILKVNQNNKIIARWDYTAGEYVSEIVFEEKN